MECEFEVGDVVQVKKVPAGCCGVLRQGWFGKVSSVITLEHQDTGATEFILILDDDTLVWSHECVLKENLYKN